MKTTKELTEILNKALDLEAEGIRFYNECLSKTKSKGGQEMFKYLAEEEAIHYDKVERMYRREFNKEYEQYRDKNKYPEKESGVFPQKVAGGSIDGRSDALDALNIALKVEENSMTLYNVLAKAPHSEKIKKFFGKLLEEEMKHHVILEKEIESVTRTGTFTDFKAVTS